MDPFWVDPILDADSHSVNRYYSFTVAAAAATGSFVLLHNQMSDQRYGCFK